MANDNRSPHEIEREIEHERAELTRTIDELQNRFAPDTMIREATDQIREHGGEIGRALGRTVKENPVALALIGAGVAWAIFGGRKTKVREKVVYRDRPPVVVDDPHLHRGGAFNDGYAEATATGYDIEREGYRSRGVFDEELDWLEDWDDDDHWDEDGRSIGDRASEAAAQARAGAGDRGPGLHDRASYAADNFDSRGYDRHDDDDDGLMDKAKAAVSDAGEKLSDATSAASAKASRLRAKFERGTEDMTDTARERVVAARQKAWIAKARAKAAAHRGWRKSRDGAADFFEDQPLVVGALAIAAGAAIAAALPRTRREDELMGETSDRLIDEAQRIFRQEKAKAEEVAHAARIAAEKIAEEKAEKVGRAAKGTAQGLDKVAKQAVRTAADEARDAGKRLEHAVKNEADRQNLGKPDA